MRLSKVTHIDALPHHRLHVTFSDGACGIHDFSRITRMSGPMAQPLRDPAFFQRVFLVYGAPTWPNGYDMCPDWLQMEMQKAGEIALPS